MGRLKVEGQRSKWTNRRGLGFRRGAKYCALALSILISSCSQQSNEDGSRPSGNIPKVEIEQIYNSGVSLRGISVINDSIAWLSGAEGRFIVTVDGGRSWLSGVIAGEDSTQFRDIEGLDDRTAIATNIGSPGKIYRTVDGGANWELVYVEKDSSVFFDALEMQHDRYGYVYSDPIDEYISTGLNNRHYILHTNDSGKTWTRLENTPKVLDPEAGFAASGSGIQLVGSKVFVATGGQEARVFKSVDQGATWDVVNTPLLHGTSSEGIYSMAFIDEQNGVVVGGNWERELSDSVAAWTSDGGQTWNLVDGDHPDGYRSVVAAFDFDGYSGYVAGGTSGIDLSTDKGKTWKKISEKPLNALQFAPRSNVGFAADGEGNVYRFTLTFDH